MITVYYRLRHLAFNLLARIINIPLPTVKCGSNSTATIAAILQEKALEKVLIVTDKGIINTGLTGKLLEALNSGNINYTLFHKVEPNPSIENVEEGLSLYRQNGCQGIIAFGGGSPLDCAKMIAARATNKKAVKKMKGLFKVRHRLPFLTAIPTTAGTGSEATIVAVISDRENKEKFSVIDPKLAPAACILDPQLTLNLPPHLTAETGMDALTHAIEAYIGLVGTPFSNQKALDAAKLIFDNLETSYQYGDNLEARKAMLEASHYAGIAFTRNYVGYVHAVAHNLGGLYGLPHGLANAIVLPRVLELSTEKGAKKMAEIARYTGLGDSRENDQNLSDRLIARIREMNHTMAIPTGIKEIQEKDIPLLAERIHREANPAYPVPRILWPKDFAELLHDLKE